MLLWIFKPQNFGNLLYSIITMKYQKMKEIMLKMALIVLLRFFLIFCSSLTSFLEFFLTVFSTCFIASPASSVHFLWLSCSVPFFIILLICLCSFIMAFLQCFFLYYFTYLSLFYEFLVLVVTFFCNDFFLVFCFHFADEVYI